MKEDEGPYSITVTNPAGEDKAELVVKIVGQWLFSPLISLYGRPFLFLLLTESYMALLTKREENNPK